MRRGEERRGYVGGKVGKDVRGLAFTVCPIAPACRHPLELTVALLVEMHRTKDALKLLACLLSRVHGARQQHLFFGLARLYAKHGLNKDALVSKLPSLCSMPPDRRTWELLKSMAEVLHLRRLALSAPAPISPLPCRPALSQCTPTAVEQQLQKYIDEAGPGHFTHVPQITEVMCKLPSDAHGSAAKALQLLKQCAVQVQTHPPRQHSRRTCLPRPPMWLPTVICCPSTQPRSPPTVPTTCELSWTICAPSCRQTSRHQYLTSSQRRSKRFYTTMSRRSARTMLWCANACSNAPRGRTPSRCSPDFNERRLASVFRKRGRCRQS